MKTVPPVPAWWKYLHCASIHSLIFLFFAGIPSALAQVDLDSDDDDLLDAWEIQHFGALNHPDGDATDDPDGDGCNNQAECDASTNPNDPTDCLTIVDSTFSPSDSMVCWPSVRGKRYNIQVSEDLNTWTTLSDSGGTAPLDFRGTGDKLKADFSTPADPKISGAVTRELYIGNVTGSLASLVADPDYPNNPDGKEWLSETRGPTEDGNNYGQRISGFIVPKQSGNFTFYIAGRHQCEFYLSTDDDPANLGARKAWLLNGNLFEQLDWDFLASHGANDTQKSAEIALTAGNKYYFEIRHQHQGQLDHLGVGWEGPGTNGIEIIDGDCICPVEDFSDNNAATLFDGARNKFARVITYGPLDPSTDQINPEAFDTDGDGVDDGTEIGLGGYSPYNSNSAGGGNDGTALAAGGTANPNNDVLTATTSDGIGRENRGIAGNGIPRYQDNARFNLNRAGSLEAKTLFFTLATTTDSNKGAASDQDYKVKDLEGGEITSTGGTYAVTLPFGANQVQIEIDPELDELVEYPEEVSLVLIGGSSSAVCEIEDAMDPVGGTPDSDENFDNEFVRYYIGTHEPEPNINPTNPPTGAAFLILSASRRYARLDNQYGNFSSAETNSHIHRAFPNTFANLGPIVKDIPDNGGGDYEQEDFFWDLASQIGALSPISVQDLVDSLEFDQIKQENPVGTPFLYVNVHTANHGSGENWAPFRKANASTDPPEDRVGPAPPVEPIDPVTEEDKLRSEIRRFLTQATFGATQQTEQELYLSIINDHGGDRIAAFDAWLTAQWAIPQTLCSDLTLALDMQEWVLRGVFLPGASGRNEPGNWPNFTSTDISNFDSLDASTWRRPDTNYPLSQTQINNAKNNAGTGEPNFNNRRRAQWMIWTYGKDQLRQRVGAALQEIMVISAEATDIRNHHIGTARYIDHLAENADDHFRECLEDVTYSSQMGKYLSHLQNSRESTNGGPGSGGTGVPPDENYAREIMQLFSIGLLELWDDGFIKLDPTTKNITQTYGNPEITELARIMTGLSWATNSSSQNNWDTPNIHTDLDVTNGSTEDAWYDDAPGNKYYSSRHNYPMIMYRGEHDNGTKTIAGGKVISNNQTTSGRYTNEGHKDLRDVHNYFGGTQNDATGPKTFAADWSTDPLTNHQNTPSFISRRLIQRLVTSNPSPDYLYRVAQVWRNTNGQLDNVVRAILLDPEARNCTAAQTNPEYGKKKEHIIAYIQAIRALNGRSHITLDGTVIEDDAYEPFDLIGAADGLDPRVLPGVTLTNGGTLAPIQDAQLDHFQYPAAQLANFQGASKYDTTGQLVNTGGSNFQNHVATQLRYGRTDTGTTSQLRQTPLRAPTVFNWFLPDYQPAGEIASYGLFAPEFQIADENSVIQNINYYWTLGWGSTGQSVNQLGGNNTNQIAAGYDSRTGNGNNYFDDNIILDYWTWMNKWNNYPDIPGNGLSNEQDKDLQLIQELDDILNAGRMQGLYPFDPSDDNPSGNQGALPHFADRNPLETFVHVLTDSYGTNTNNIRDKIRLAFYLMLTSPEYLTQK